MKRNTTAIVLLVVTALVAIPRPANAQEEGNTSPETAASTAPSSAGSSEDTGKENEAIDQAGEAAGAEPESVPPDPAAKADASVKEPARPTGASAPMPPTTTRPVSHPDPNPDPGGERNPAAAAPASGPRATTTTIKPPPPATTTMYPTTRPRAGTGADRPQPPSWDPRPDRVAPRGSAPSADFAGWIGVGLSAVAVVGLAGILFLLVRRIPSRKDFKDLNEDIKREIEGGVKPFFDKMTDLDLDARFNTLDRAVSTIGTKIEKLSSVSGEQTRKNETFWSSVMSLFRGKVDEGQKNLSVVVSSLDGMLKQLQEVQRRIADESASCARKVADADHKAAEANRVLADVEARVQTAVRAAQAKTREELQRSHSARDQELDLLKANAIKAAQEKERGVREELQTLVKDLGQTKLELGTFRERLVSEGKSHQAALADKEEKARAKISAIQRELDETKASFDSRLSTERLKLEKAVSDANEAKIAALRSEADEARKRLSEAEGRHSEEVAGYRKKVEEALGAKARAESDGKAAVATVSAELDKVRSALEKSIAAAEEERTEAKSKLAKQREETEAALADGAALRARLYPAEFSDAAAFGPLRESLEDWDVRKVPGAEIVKAGLGLFANRSLVEPEVWRSALRDISIGLAAVSAKEGRKPAETVAEMARWAKFLSGLSTPAARFTLKIPEIGSQVDVGWMDCKSRSVTVRNVSSWAVYGDMGVVYQAKVD